MKNKLLIKSKNLKEFLLIFETYEILHNLSLGDTCHPSSGYITEEILGENPTVKSLLSFNYEFEGLIEFVAKISTFEIKAVNSCLGEGNIFEITAAECQLRTLRYKIIEINTLVPSVKITEFNQF